MANLVPLVLDLDTGQVRAGDPNQYGGGGGAGGYVHTQNTDAATWTITHNLSSTQVIYMLFDLAGEQIIPDTFKIIDNNTVEVTFGIAMSGKLHLMYFVSTP